MKEVTRLFFECTNRIMIKAASKQQMLHRASTKLKKSGVLREHAGMKYQRYPVGQDPNRNRT